MLETFHPSESGQAPFKMCLPRLFFIPILKRIFSTGLGWLEYIPTLIGN